MQRSLRVMIAAVVFLLVQNNAQAQYGSYTGKQPIMVPEDGIRQITVDGNIDVVIREAAPGKTTVKVSHEHRNLLNATVDDGRLVLSARKSVPEGSRLLVYVWVYDLKELTLKQSAFAASVGVPDFRNLEVNIRDNARVALRTAGRMIVHAPDSHQLLRDEKYYSVYATIK